MAKYTTYVLELKKEVEANLLDRHKLALIE